jgi:Flp pilus assembly protein TadD
VGDVLQAQGKLESAQGAFGESLKISRRLAEQDPTNAGCLRELAVAHYRVGSVLEAQGKLEAARLEYMEDLRISEYLAELDPSNALWQQDLAVSQRNAQRLLLRPSSGSDT